MATQRTIESSRSWTTARACLLGIAAVATLGSMSLLLELGDPPKEIPASLSAASATREAGVLDIDHSAVDWSVIPASPLEWTLSVAAGEP